MTHHASRHLSRAAVVTGAAVAVALVAGGIAAAVAFSRGTTSGPQARGADSVAPPPAASIAFVGVRRDHVPWNKPLSIQITHGRITAVEAMAADGTLLDGTLASDGSRWTGARTLVPLTGYSARVSYVDLEGKHHHQTLHTAAADTAQHLTATLSPGDGDVVGVGMPVAVLFNRWVPEAQRAAVERRLAVVADPDVDGAWHWMNGQEVHWRPPTYWKTGTSVTVSSDLDHLDLGNGVWGTGRHVVTFRIGSAHFSVVDVARHTMTVYADGKAVRSMAISAGRDRYPTMGGVHIALEKAQLVIMDSATVGIPKGNPDYYYEKVYWNVRISNGGAFVHAAPWSVAQQGRSNVSHGCVNLAPANAIWFFNFAQRGDVISVYNTPRPPSPSDPGTSDWNMSWAQWLAGQASPVSEAQREADYKGSVAPKAPSYATAYVPPPPATASPKPTTSATPKPTASATPTGH